MEFIYKVNDCEVSQSVFFDLLDNLRDYFKNYPKLLGTHFRVEKIYFSECGNFKVTSNIIVDFSVFQALYLEKLKDINDALGL